MPPSDLYHYRPKICLTRRRTNGKVIYFPSGEERQYLHRPTKTIRGWAPFCPFTRKSGARMGPVGMVELGCTLLTLRQSGMIGMNGEGEGKESCDRRDRATC